MTIRHNTALSALTARQIAELEAIRRQIDAMLPADVKKSETEIEARLAQICTDAEQRGDETTYRLACETWADVQKIAASTEMAAGLAAGNALATQVAAQQRDDLLEAIKHEDEDHPIVGRLIENVREDEYYRTEIAAYDQAHSDVVAGAVKRLSEWGMDEHSAQRLAALVVRGYRGMGDEYITDDQLRAIGQVAMEQLSYRYARR